MLKPQSGDVNTEFEALKERVLEHPLLRPKRKEALQVPKKDAVCATAALKEALLMCENRNLHQIMGSRDYSHPGIQADGGGEFTNKKVQDLCWEKNISIVILPCSSTIFQWHRRANGWYAQDYSAKNVEAGKSRQRMVVLRMSICGPHDERESTRKRMAIPSIWSVWWAFGSHMIKHKQSHWMIEAV